MSEMGGSYMTEFFQDRFYVRLSVTKKSEEMKKIISSGEPQTDFIVRPRSLNLVGDFQSLKVEISGSLYYMVEIVRTKSEDAWVPDQGVLIYKVDGGITDEACVDQDRLCQR